VENVCEEEKEVCQLLGEWSLISMPSWECLEVVREMFEEKVVFKIGN